MKVVSDWDDLDVEAFRRPRLARAGTPPEVQRRTLPRGSSRTLASWILALLPLLQTVIVIADTSARHSFQWFTVVLMALLSMAIGVLVATQDQRTLTARGYEAPTSPYAGTFPIIYLFLRGHRCVVQNHEGLGPAWANLGVWALLVACATIFEPWIRAFWYLSSLAAG